MSLELVIQIFVVVFNIIISILILSQMIKLKIKTLGYFISAFFLFTIDDFSNLLLLLNPTWSIITDALSIIGLSLGLYLILIFLESFHKENPFRKLYSILGVICVAFSTMLLFINTSIFIIVPDIDLIGTPGLSNPINRLAAISIYLMYISIGALVVLIFVFGFLFIRTIFLRLKKTENVNYKATFRKILISLLVYTFGSGLDFIIPTLAKLIQVISYFCLFIVIMSKGIHIFQAENLHYLFVFNQAGIAPYTFSFEQLNQEKPSNKERTILQKNDSVGILLPAVLKAIFTLLSDLTGTNQNVQEIRLEHETILVSSSLDKKYAVVLLLEEPNEFYRTTTSQFTQQFFTDFPDLHKNKMMAGKDLAHANSLIRKYYGF
ncbi:hypothetical protein [Candidatus Lokiarchaeum ossiferum]|uniref:hypothetical protein n=1 Tax=Candidatus Lokiarchaeum ossiferum TaxID=2951803 RepID=UPI00352D34C4